jgi:hypothetical protein
MGKATQVWTPMQGRKPTKIPMAKPRASWWGVSSIPATVSRKPRNFVHSRRTILVLFSAPELGVLSLISEIEYPRSGPSRGGLENQDQIELIPESLGDLLETL